MSKVIKKIVDFYNSLTSSQKLFVIIGFAVLLMLFYLIFISNNYRSSDINYKNLTIDTILEQSSIVYDRDDCLIMDGIINNILKINNSAWYVDNKPVTLKKLYNSAVIQTYKKKMSRGKFIDTMSGIYTNVLGDEGLYDSSSTYIDTLYYSSKYDMYLVKLKSVNDSENYIGIRIVNNNYYITFVKWGVPNDRW